MKPADIEKERRSMLKFYAPAGFLLGAASYYVYAVEPWGVSHPGVIAGTLIAILLAVIGLAFGIYRKNHPFDKKTMRKNYQVYGYFWAILAGVLILLILDRFGLNLRDTLLESSFWSAFLSIVFAGASLIAGWAAYARVGLFQRTK